MWCHFWEKHTDDRKQVDEWSVKKENKSQKSSYTETNLIKSIKVKEVGHKFDLEFPNSQSKDRNTIYFKIYSVHRWKQARSQEKPTDKSFGDWEKFFPIGFAKEARLIILQSSSPGWPWPQDGCSECPSFPEFCSGWEWPGSSVILRFQGGAHYWVFPNLHLQTLPQSCLLSPSSELSSAQSPSSALDL